MPPYLFDSILLNGNEIALKDILSEKFIGSSEFEKHTISFIQHWFNETKDFTFQTSGSTGEPKLIQISREQIQHSALLTIQTLKLQPRETALICLHTKYIAGSMMLARALVNDMRIIAIEPSSDPLALLNQTVDFVAFVPLQLHTMLLQNKEGLINAIRTIIVGGASMSTSLKSLTREKVTTSLFMTYGMTETISHVALQPITPHYRDTFEALPGITLSTDSRDCLIIKANYVGPPVITNDLVNLNGETTFQWLGRIDNVINSGGLKVIPERVEETIGDIFKSLNIDRRLIISGEPDAYLGHKVVLLVEGKPLRKRLHEFLLNKLTQRLLAHQTPKHIYYLPRFVETESGKINRLLTLKNIANSAKTLQ